MEQKFLSDGRKVVVVGQLNNTEWIVQEVFVSSAGDEVPSGERFVTKSLHEFPVETWKSKEEKKLEESLKSLKQKQDEIQSSIRKLEMERQAYSKAFSSTKRLYDTLSSQLDAGAFELLCDVMAGNIKYIVEASDYGIYEPKLFMEQLKSPDSYNMEIKLISLFGKSDGSLTYKMSQYYDGSGRNGDVIFIKTDEELAKYYTDKVKSIYEKNPQHMHYHHIETALRWGATVDDSIIEAARKVKADSIKEQIEKQKKDLEAKMKELNNFMGGN